MTKSRSKTVKKPKYMVLHTWKDSADGMISDVWSEEFDTPSEAQDAVETDGDTEDEFIILRVVKIMKTTSQKRKRDWVKV